MPPTITSPKSLRALAIRATLLDDCGRPVDVAATTKTQISTSGFISLAVAPDIEEGEKIRKYNADGSICINNNDDCDKTVGLEITLVMCQLSPHIFELLAGATQLTNENSDVVGGIFPGINGVACPPHVMLEFWAENVNKKCDSEGRVCRYIRYILPNTFRWTWSNDITFEKSDSIEWELKGYAEGSEYFDTPYENDPDLSEANIEAIREKDSPFAWICSNSLPEIINDNWVNP